jgi:transposase, IS5 family
MNNLSDDRIEYQIRDRLSFMRFLGLQLESRVPDAKTIWLFRERLEKLNRVDELFAKFHEQLALMTRFVQWRFWETDLF